MNETVEPMAQNINTQPSKLVSWLLITALIIFGCIASVILDFLFTSEITTYIERFVIPLPREINPAHALPFLIVAVPSVWLLSRQPRNTKIWQIVYLIIGTTIGTSILSLLAIFAFLWGAGHSN